MFDARSILENLVRGAGQPQQQSQAGGPGGGGLADILGQLAQSLGQPGQGGPAGSSGQAGGGMGSLQDILRNLTQQSGQAPQQTGQAAAPAPGGGGGLADILGKLQQQMSAPGAAGSGGGGLMDILGQVLSQATQGVKEGAQRVDQATGASDRMREATGKSPEDLLNQLKDLIANNPGGAAAAGAGLGGVILGTQAGRALAGSALRIGALALIGGLAYKAVQNYQQGKPLLSPNDPQQASLIEAPRGSGFESSAVTHDAAVLYIRGMIASAAADGRIDPNEQKKILGGLQQAGMGPEAQAFLTNELQHPASPAELASAVNSPEEAVQLFTAARIAVDLDNNEEREFLVKLAKALGLDGQLVAHIDAAARAT
jgi:uncharacterized membrane protein YebE (DUF533 family)